MPATLRRILLSPGPPPNLSELAATFPSMPSSPGYVTFCSPDEVLVIEKDLKSAVIHTSSEFLAVTNHDKQVESWSQSLWEEALRKAGPELEGIQALLEDSVERKAIVTEMFHGSSLEAAPRFDHVKTWLNTKPILNETTHFSCIMDPAPEGGQLVWVRAYETPVNMDDSEHSEASSFE
jgi:hypothetical protein